MKQWRYAVSSADEAPETSPILLQGTIKENLIKASKLGYDAIEIHTREDEDFNYEEIKAKMDKYDVRIAQIVTGRLNTEGKCSLMADEPYIVEVAVKRLKQYIDIASKLDTDIVIGWVKGNIPAGKNKAKYMSRLARHLKTLSDYGKEKKVKLNIEVINSYETNVFNTSKELVDFLEQYELDNCYVHLDTFHMSICESDSVEAILLSKGRLGYFHIADNQRWYPGSGELNFKPMYDALEEINYEGYISVECLPHGSGEDTAKKALEFLKTL